MGDKTEITKALLEQTNYFELQDLLEKHGIFNVFKGGKSKIKIIEQALEAYNELEKKIRISNKIEVIEVNEPFTYKTDEDGNLIDLKEVIIEMSNVRRHAALEQRPVEVAPVEKPIRSVEVIEAHLVKVIRNATSGLPSHMKVYAKRVIEIQDELDVAKALVKKA